MADATVTITIDQESIEEAKRVLGELRQQTEPVYRAQVEFDIARAKMLQEGAEQQAEQFLRRALRAEEFKKYVHRKLDEFGVPHDPDPEHNAKHGCRIEGRLNWLFQQWKNDDNWFAIVREEIRIYGLKATTRMWNALHRRDS